MLTSTVVNLARTLVFVLIVGCGIAAMYSATNAISVYSNYDVFVSGLVAILLGAVLNPLFCYISAYGMLYYLDVPAWQVWPVTAVVLVAWLIGVSRLYLPKPSHDSQ